MKASGAYEAALRDEAAGVLAWAIGGTQLWLDEDDGNDIALPQSIIDQRDSHISGQSPADEFVNDWCTFGEDTEGTHGYYRCFKADVRSRYDWWLVNVKGKLAGLDPDAVKGLTKVYDVLDGKARAGQPTIGEKQGRGWFGVHLVDDDEHWARTQR